jgi:electron transport complex protein RnfA
MAFLLMSGIRERIDRNTNIPKCLQGLPIALVTAGLMSIAFMGFNGIVK